MSERAKKVLLLSALIMTIILFASFSLAQEKTSRADKGGGMGYSIMGTGTIDISALNSKLESESYNAMSDKFFSVGGGGHIIRNNGLIIGGEGHALLGDEATSGNYKNSVYIGYGFLDLGYIIYSLQELRFYPLLGIGFGGMTLKITEKLTSLSFNEVLNDPERKVELTTGGFLLNLAIGIDYLLKFGENKKEKGGLVLGIRAGYTFTPVKGEWMMDELEISGAPKIGITGPYIRFIIGGGGFNK